MTKFVIIASITGYLICGIIFMTIIEDNQPEIIRNHQVLRIPVSLLSMILWLPWVLCAVCFTKRDIWFRRIKDGRF